MKIGLLQCNLTSNDIERNVHTLYQAVCKAAEQGAELCLGSELALCGCPATEQLARSAFVTFCRDNLQALATRLNEENLPPLLVGAPIANPVPQGKPLHNCAVFLRGGKVMVIARKVLLVADGTHDDYFYFEPGVACGVLQHNGWRFAVAIGEDVWNDRGFWHGRRQFDTDPVEEFMTGGADALLNPSAIPFIIGGIEQHKKVLSWTAAKYRTPVVTVNQIGGMDSAIYPGGSMVFNSYGNICHQAAKFAEDVLVVDLSRLEDPSEKDASSKEASAADNTTDNEIKAVTGGAGSAKPADYEEELWQALVLGVRDFSFKCGFSKAVLGLSGGIDSALVAAIAAEALGGQNVLGVLMPSPYSSRGSVEDSLLLAANLGIETVTIPIEPAMQAMNGMLQPAFAGLASDTTEENIQSRLRCVTVMAFSNKFGRIWLNTSNKSEAAVGYGTLYGDSGGALGVIVDLYKDQVYALSNWINKRHGRDLIPQAIIDKVPSAELRPDQKDSDSLPDYPVLDAILRAHLDERNDLDELVKRGFDEALSKRILSMLRRAEFKRRQLPPGLHVSRSAFGQSGRLPIATTFK
ncbi:MAG: NAD+ synthase [Deltaproteobacteria bacterium]|jgi:NAD+ synthase (glutamine-hydrolysing)|nr:NAD+ synthase [Deltaproteobacteria bacterium]